MSDKRTKLRTTFNHDAPLYDRARPGYPHLLFEDIVRVSGIPPGGRILELGCGTGQATLPFAKMGFQILCIELGKKLADVARAKLAPYPRVRIINASFEEYQLEPEAFDLLVAATMFHWLDPATRIRKSADALKPGGYLAIFSTGHVKSPNDGDFFEEVQAVYERESPVSTKGFNGLSRPEDVRIEVADEIRASGLFEEPYTRKYVWDQTYDAESYTDLLMTYSDHIALPDDERGRLLRGIADLINAYGGQITKGYLTTLCLARRIADCDGLGIPSQ